MATIPRKCQHCGELVHHYGACTCPDATLDWIDAEVETKTEISVRIIDTAMAQREQRQTVYRPA